MALFRGHSERQFVSQRQKIKASIRGRSGNRQASKHSTATASSIGAILWDGGTLPEALPAPRYSGWSGVPNWLAGRGRTVPAEAGQEPRVGRLRPV